MLIRPRYSACVEQPDAAARPRVHGNRVWVDGEGHVADGAWVTVDEEIWGAFGGLDGIQAPSWFSLALPARVPADIRNRLEEEVRRALSDPDLRSRLQKAGMDVVAIAGARMAQMIVTESAYNASIVKRLGYKPE